MVETVLATIGTAATATAGTTAAEAAFIASAQAAAGVTASSVAATTGAGILSTVGSYLSTGFTLLSGVGTVMGAVGQVQAGKERERTLMDQANQTMLNSRIEKVNAENTANQMRKQLISSISTANAMFASRGIGIGSGTPEQAKAEGARNAGASIDLARFGGDMNANSDIIQSGVYRRNASSARVAGYGEAASTLANSKSLQTLLNI